MGRCTAESQRMASFAEVIPAFLGSLLMPCVLLKIVGLSYTLPSPTHSPHAPQHVRLLDPVPTGGADIAQTPIPILILRSLRSGRICWSCNGGPGRIGVVFQVRAVCFSRLLSGRKVHAWFQVIFLLKLTLPWNSRFVRFPKGRAPMGLTVWGT